MSVNTIRGAAAPVAAADVDTKDIRRRGVELDMAHKAHDRAKGHFHSGKGRWRCTICNGGHPRTSRGAPVFTANDCAGAAHEAKGSDLWEPIAVDLEHDDDDDGASHSDSSGGDLHDCGIGCEHIMGAKVVYRSFKKRKGVANDFEFIPSATSVVRALDDEPVVPTVSPTPQDDWEHIDLDDDVPPAVPRSYSTAVRSA